MDVGRRKPVWPRLLYQRQISFQFAESPSLARSIMIPITSLKLTSLATQQQKRERLSLGLISNSLIITFLLWWAQMLFCISPRRWKFFTVNGKCLDLFSFSSDSAATAFTSAARSEKEVEKKNHFIFRKSLFALRPPPSECAPSKRGNNELLIYLLWRRCGEMCFDVLLTLPQKFCGIQNNNKRFSDVGARAAKRKLKTLKFPSLRYKNI